MKYRTKTYLAGDWTGDEELIKKIKEWNKDNNLGLSFTDVHELTSSSDSSLNCSIKSSLRQRLSICKTFVLIVGKKTRNLRSGACYLCANYRNNSWLPYCANSFYNYIDNRSFVDFECDMALKDYRNGELKNIVVIYNGLEKPDKSLCPDSLKNVGIHIGSDVILTNGQIHWNYNEIKNAICK